MVTIREATREDANAVAALAAQLAAHESTHSNFGAKDFLRDGFGAKPAFSCLVAERDQKILGFVLFYPGYDLGTAARGMHLSDLVVDEACRGQGIGTALMAALAKHTLMQGGKWVSFTVLKHNGAAQQFYQKLHAAKVAVDFMAWGEQALRALVSGVTR